MARRRRSSTRSSSTRSRSTTRRVRGGLAAPINKVMRDIRRGVNSVTRPLGFKL